MVGKSLVARESGREEQLNDFVRYPVAQKVHCTYETKIYMKLQV